MANSFTVEVVYALPHTQKLMTVEVEEGTTLLEAVKLSNIEAEFPELNLEEAKLGVFGKASAKPNVDTVKAGDRIEIYRPLIIDPKQARLNRAAKAKS